MDNNDLQERMKIAQKNKMAIVDRIGKWIMQYVWLGCIAYVLATYLSH